ncbi:putative membrane protein [Paenibacillus sp. OAS669]|nr:putative membrane protein [Paenibacillus sp. OAS669]
MLFAVTLPAHVMDDADIRGIQARFNKRLTRASVGMAAFMIPLALLHDWSAYQVIYFFVWLVTFHLWVSAPFRHAFRETLALKRERDWFVGAKRVLRSDLRVAHLKNQRSAPLWLFAIPFAMAIGMLLWGKGDPNLLGITLSVSILTLLFFLATLMMRRTKAKVYSANSEVNLVLNQARRRYTSYLWLVIAIVESIHFWLIGLFMTSSNEPMEGVWVTVTLLFIVVPVGVILYVYRKIASLERETLEQDGKIIYTDDDEYWSNGFTYHNPQDRSILVPKRVGIGETVNTGTWAGKIIVGGSIGVAAAVIIGVSFMLIRSELTPPVLTVTDGQRIQIDYPMYSYDFQLADIKQMDLVDTVPSGIKTNGEATDKQARGHFRLKDLGNARMYIFKNNPPYIRIKLDEGYIFYNEKDPSQTKQLFEQIQGQISK